MLLADTMWIVFGEWFYLPKRLNFFRRPDPQSFPDIHCLWINLFLKGSLLLFFSTLKLLCSFALFARDDHSHEHESHILGNILLQRCGIISASPSWNFEAHEIKTWGRYHSFLKRPCRALQAQWDHLIFVEARQLLCGPLYTLGKSNLY